MEEINAKTNKRSETNALELRVQGEYAPVDDSFHNRVRNPQQDGLRLPDYWHSMRKHLRSVIGTMIILLALLTIYLVIKADIYEAQARLQVDLENDNPMLVLSKNNSFVFTNPVNDPFYFNKQLQHLSSPSLLRRVVRTLDLENNETFVQTLSGHSRFQRILGIVGLGSKGRENTQSPAPDDLLGSTSSASAEDLAEAKRLAPYVDALSLRLKVEPVKETRLSLRETRLIDVSFDDTDPRFAAKVVNAIADALLLLNLEEKTRTTSAPGDFLQKRIAELQAKIHNGEEQLINYSDRPFISAPDANQNKVLGQLVDLDKQLLETENDRELAEFAYRAALIPPAKEAIKDDRTLKEIDEQVALLKGKVDEPKATANAPDISNLEDKWRQAMTREDDLRKAFEHERSEVIKQNGAAIAYRITQQEIETNKELLTALRRSKQSDLILASMSNNIRVAEYAFTPDEPISPKRLQIVAIGLLFSIGFGVGLALFLTHLDNSVRSVEHVENILHLPVLGLIPKVESPMRRLPFRALARRGKEIHRELLMGATGSSRLAEAYRQLRTSLVLLPTGRAPQTLLVTSSVRSEGKTTTAINIATTLAQLGANVLIVDADMRCPSLHSIFNLENRDGLSTILSGELSETEIFAIIQKHEQSGLHLLVSGPIPSNPAELLGSKELCRVTNLLQSAFTYVIIDSPPIAAFTDGVIIASTVDGVLLVVQSGKTSPDLVRRSQQLLADIGARILGVVLNNAELGRHG